MNHSQVEALYRDEYAGLVRLAARNGRSSAEDAVQDAFEALLEGKHGDEDPLTFLVRRVKNISASEASKERRQAAILLKESGATAPNARLRGATASDSSATEPKAYEPGELFGFPYNGLQESTWS